MTRELYRHQARGLDALPATGGYLAFEQGLGKTVTAIRFAQAHGYATTLIICPAVAIGVWLAELDLEGIRGVSAPHGTRVDKATQIGAIRGQYCILNYEALLEPAVERAIQRWNPSLVIVDEAQKIKTSSAKRSRVVHRLTRDRPALLLSGTPITKNLLDLYSQYKAVDPGIWDNVTWTKFKQRYAIMGGYLNYEVIGYRDTEDMKARIAPYTVVARKENTLDLPTKTHTIVPVTLGSSDWTSYSQMAREGVADGWVTSNPLEKALRLSQISGRAKLDATAAFVRDIREAGEPVVVYFRFRAEGSALEELLGVPQLTGDTKAEVRTQMVEDFQNGTGKIFLSQVAAGSTAITLTAASHMVYHSLSYAYEDWAQSQDRIHRIGQDNPCFYYYMSGVGPKGGQLIDGLVLNSLNSKEDLAGIITRDPALLLPED
jgi:SNF2 family DNA or RNA helicase